MKRSRMEMAASILYWARVTHRYTRIMALANINPKPMKQLVAALLDQGLLAREGKLYRVTPTALAWLQQYNALRNAIAPALGNSLDLEGLGHVNVSAAEGPGD